MSRNNSACDMVAATAGEAKGKEMIKFNIINLLIRANINPAVVSGLLFAAGASC